MLPNFVKDVEEKAYICKYPFQMVYGFESLLQKHWGANIDRHNFFVSKIFFVYNTCVKRKNKYCNMKQHCEVYNGINDFYTNDKLPFYSILLFIRFINEIDFSKKSVAERYLLWNISLGVNFNWCLQLFEIWRMISYVMTLVYPNI